VVDDSVDTYFEDRKRYYEEKLGLHINNVEGIKSLCTDYLRGILASSYPPPFPPSLPPSPPLI